MIGINEQLRGRPISVDLSQQAQPTVLHIPHPARPRNSIDPSIRLSTQQPVEPVEPVPSYRRCTRAERLVGLQRPKGRSVGRLELPHFKVHSPSPSLSPSPSPSHQPSLYGLRYRSNGFSHHCPTFAGVLPLLPLISVPIVTLTATGLLFQSSTSQSVEPGEQ